MALQQHLTHTGDAAEVTVDLEWRVGIEKADGQPSVANWQRLLFPIPDRLVVPEREIRVTPG